MIVEIILGLAIILSGVLGWTTYNQLQKVERLEDWVENYSARIIQTKNVLDELDSEGKFESDDEIGTVFEGIKDTVNDLTKITEILEIDLIATVENNVGKIDGTITLGKAGLRASEITIEPSLIFTQ